MPPSIYSALFLLLLFVVLPWLSARTERSGHILQMSRGEVYISASFTQWLVIALMFGVIWLDGSTLASIGLTDGGLELGDLIEQAILLVVAALGVGFAIWLVRRALGWPESNTIRYLIPRTDGERLLFALVVSPTAGMCEELLYRGFAISRLEGVVGGPWQAAILACFAFSFGHIYQGVLGMVRAGLIGIVLAVPFLLTGSLWPSILAHTAIDILSALVLHWTFLEGPGRDAVRPGDVAAKEAGG